LTKPLVIAAGLLAGVAAAATLTPPLRAQSAVPAWTASLTDVRRVAAVIPGRRPLRVNVLKFAESRRTKNFSVRGAPAVPSVQARTVFQVVYAWVPEDEGAVLDQLRWLNDLSRREQDLFIVASHDDAQQTELIQKGILGTKLE
jgi:hypothetical protein